MECVTVTAASRLHLGLWSLGGGAAFGGVGVMVERPALRLRLSPAPALTVGGRHARRAERAARRSLQQSSRAAGEVGCLLDIEQAPDEHAGLGLGTQLSLAVAAGLDAWLGKPPGAAADLAVRTGRARRSSVGVHGFEHGGLIVDGGHSGDAPVGKLMGRVTIPAAWRAVLFRPHAPPGRAGPAEADAFGRLPPVPAGVTTHLMRLACQEIAPAATGGDFARFAAAVGEYGRTAGNCFARVQSGPFASPAVASLVDRVNNMGFAAAGQSSWGPTVFVFASEPDQARWLCDRVRRSTDLLTQPTITPIAARGADVRVARGDGGPATVGGQGA